MIRLYTYHPFAYHIFVESDSKIAFRLGWEVQCDFFWVWTLVLYIWFHITKALQVDTEPFPRCRFVWPSNSCRLWGAPSNLRCSPWRFQGLGWKYPSLSRGPWKDLDKSPSSQNLTEVVFPCILWKIWKQNMSLHGNIVTSHIITLNSKQRSQTPLPHSILTNI